MKYCFSLTAAAAALLLVTPSVSGAENHSSFVYESATEFYSSGDFDGDGRQDLIIVDKESGKYRIGYQQTDGSFSWVDCRLTAMKNVSGFTVGKLIDAKQDALAITAPDASQIIVVGAASPKEESHPKATSFTAALGPSAIVAVDIGGTPRKGIADFYVASIYNSPEANLGSLLRNDGAEYPKVEDEPLAGLAVRGNRVSLKNSQPEMLCLLVRDEKGDTLRVEDLSSGKPQLAATATGLPAGADYAVGSFRSGSALRDFVIYKPGESKLVARPVEESSPGHYQIGAGNTFDLGQPVRRVVTLHGPAPDQLFVLFGEGEKAGRFPFGGA